MLNDGDRVKVFPYIVVKEKPLSELAQFSNHRRLKVFFHKGCTCVNCGLVGTRLIQGRNPRDGSLHWDVYSDELIPLTVDHIQPKSLGGPNTLENYQVMCAPCNTLKGNGLSARSAAFLRNSPKARGLTRYREGMDIIGKELWRVRKDLRREPMYLGIVNSIGINPHCQRPAIIVIGKKVSFFNIDRSLFVKDSVNPQGVK